MLFDDKFLESLDDDPKIAIYNICGLFLEKHHSNQTNYHMHLEVYSLVEAVVTANDVEIEMPQLSEDRKQRMENIHQFVAETKNTLHQYLVDLKDQELLQQYREAFATKFPSQFMYEFSDEDLDRVQSLVVMLREEIAGSELFEQKYRRRLANRIERLQQDLHKKVSDLDHFWGLVGDAGVVLGKFGQDAQQLVRVIKEITDIVWRTQSSAEELPSGSMPPRLGSD